MKSDKSADEISSGSLLRREGTGSVDDSGSEAEWAELLRRLDDILAHPDTPDFFRDAIEPLARERALLIGKKE
jgi:hypothetical protein